MRDSDCQRTTAASAWVVFSLRFPSLSFLLLIGAENKGKPEEEVRRVKLCFLSFLFFIVFFVSQCKCLPFPAPSSGAVCPLKPPKDSSDDPQPPTNLRLCLFFYLPLPPTSPVFLLCFVLFSFVGSPPTELCLESFLAGQLIIPAATKVTLSEVPVKRLPT